MIDLLFCSLYRFSLCLIYSSPKVDVLPCHQPQWRKTSFLQQTSESGATISSWHREGCKLTVHNPDLCHLHHCYSHWPILDKINSSDLDKTDKYRILNISEDERRQWKTVEQVLLSQRKFSCFSSGSPDILMWKREKTRDICCSSALKITGDSPLSRPFHGQKSEIKQNREPAAVNKAVCGFCAFLPWAASSNGSYTNILATHSVRLILTHHDKKNWFLDFMKDVVFVRFYYKHKHFMCDL